MFSCLGFKAKQESDVYVLLDKNRNSISSNDPILRNLLDEVGSLVQKVPQDFRSRVLMLIRDKYDNQPSLFPPFTIRITNVFTDQLNMSKYENEMRPFLEIIQLKLIKTHVAGDSENTIEWELDKIRPQQFTMQNPTAQTMNMNSSSQQQQKRNLNK